MSQIESFVERGGKYAGRKQEWGEGKGGRVEQNGDTTSDEMRRADMEREQHKTNFLIVNMPCVHCSLQKKKLLKGISILLK